jgi:hypothetical protein
LPEVFFFTELATDPRFKTSDPDVICMPCAMCKSNTHVQHVRPSYDAGAEAVRFYAGSSSATAIVCMIYKCTNPNCVGVQAAARNRSKKEPNAKRAKQTVAYQFRSTAADQLAMLPKYVRTQFPCVLLRVGGYSFDLADVLLTSAANSMQTATQVHEMWGRRQYIYALLYCLEFQSKTAICCRVCHSKNRSASAPREICQTASYT